jgi:hypothetical protein
MRFWTAEVVSGKQGLQREKGHPVSDKQLVITLPETLIAQAEAAHLDLQALLQRAVSDELNRQQFTYRTLHPMTMADKEFHLRELLAPDRLEDGLRLLREGKPIPGLFAHGAPPLGDEAMKPLPDEFWGDLFT